MYHGQFRKAQNRRICRPTRGLGFRHLFGQEPNKEILIEFLNDLFQGKKHVADLEYAPNEHDQDYDRFIIRILSIHHQPYGLGNMFHHLTDTKHLDPQG